MNILLKFYLLVAICVYVVSSEEELPMFWCQLDSNNYCRFTNVHLNATHPYFRPAAQSNRVTKIAFDISTIPVFSDDICKTFPYLEELVVRSSKVEAFIEKAFYECKNLKILDFYTNKLTEIHESTFKFNEKLEKLRIDSNQLKSLPLNLFVNLINLTSLYLGDNQLDSFSAYLVHRNKNLKHLYIHSNHFLDLDYKKLIEYLPNLEVIEYNANQFSCAHVSEMNAAFAEHGVTLGTISVARKRFYPQELVGNILCSPDISWSSAYYRTELNQLDDSDNLLYTKKEVKQMINRVVEESSRELKKEIQELKEIIQAVSYKINIK
uniref:Uncharacterized protein n=1 Tax=Culicoides sonorensis TaxID=179676 RepID=Q5QBK0_CULSO|nr:unknown [Culicoides sonorensis]